MSSPLLTPRLGGWTRTMLIELADRRTERRGSKTLDLNSEFIMALQHFIMETRWMWRRKFTQLMMQAGVWQYDLTDPNGADANDYQQFTKHGVKYYPNPNNVTQWSELTPMFERGLQTTAMYTNLNFPQPAPPIQYFTNNFLTLCITPVPDQSYPMTLDYWACPNVSIDSMDESIPMVPAFLHHVLLKRLEAQIFRYTIGEGATKYQACMAEYKMLCDRYQGMDGMVPGEHQDYSSDDDYESTMRNSDNAVQSTV